MEAAIIRSIIAGIEALVKVAPAVAAVFMGGRSLDELESDATAALARSKRASEEWGKDIQARKARGDEPTKP